MGIVVKAYRIHEEVALKIRRVDADRAGMRHEAEMLTAANKVDVGPKLLGVSDNFLLMEFIEGKLFPEWLDSCYDKVRIRRVLRNLLEQCWRLDTAGIDHGELSHAPKHILVNAFDVPFIVDFETASLNRKPSNVTSLAQFLFINGVIADKIANILGWADRKTIICVLRHYKLNRNRENFDMILKACGI
ncbi:serine/threonine protein kinase [Candidatus Bathyarchaeota archaeon]|nr:serine/threonine protein kinase [Candidatus Bathyarchaeota archaeon]